MIDATVIDLARAMADGVETSRGITEWYLDRIARLDRDGPGLNAVIEVNPDALAIADALDVERRARGPRGPLHGIPVLLKDNIETGDRMMTTAGSLALEGSVASEDSGVARRLRAAGAVILGKANLSEWANFRSTHSISGWSSRGGQTRNPYALDRNPCGSSSGSAVAVAADLCAVAVGTETDGSIICPAQANGIVGIKPTLGLISRSGIVPIAHSQDTAGPMARTVAGAAILLGAMAGADHRDPVAVGGRDWGDTDYVRWLDAEGLHRARIGVGRDYWGFDPRVDHIAEMCLSVMSRLGAEIVDPVKIQTTKALEEPEFEVLLTEFKADLNAYLAQAGSDMGVHSLAEIIAFNRENSERVMPYFGQEIMLMAEERGPLSDAAYQRALADCRRLARTEGLDATLQRHALDAIVAPSGRPAWLTDPVNGDPHGEGGCSSMAAVAGYPHITVPAGMVFGLPVGISFIGGAWQEPALIRMAYAFEQATQVRCAPKFLPSADLGVAVDGKTD